jgi:hypothetical protein
MTGLVSLIRITAGGWNVVAMFIAFLYLLNDVKRREFE